MKIKSHFTRYPSENINEGISRPVEWQALDARMKWVRNGKHYDVTFDDELDERLTSDRLNTFLDPNSEAMERLLTKAVDQVLHHRSTDQPNAALLYIAKSIEHAKAIGDRICKLRGIRPVIATDEQDDPTSIIRGFAENTSMIAMGTVNLLREGANIKRARVGVWCTNIKSPMTLEQVIGRLNRKEYVSQLGHSTMYAPGDRDYLKTVERLEGVNLVTLDKDGNPGVARAPTSPTTTSSSSFLPIQSESLEFEAVFRGEHAAPEMIKVAQELRKKNPDLSVGISDVQLGALATTIDPTLLQKVSVPQKVETYDEKRNRLIKTVTTLSNKLAVKWGVDWAEVHRRWRQKGNPRQSIATPEELQSKIDWIISEFNAASRSSELQVP